MFYRSYDSQMCFYFYMFGTSIYLDTRDKIVEFTKCSETKADTRFVEVKIFKNHHDSHVNYFRELCSESLQ